ncbi:LacI family transcriptional regulator [Paenibacillus shirakamiensis]|uniref:LacI family transcriptional regulator n=1 Tax=Paenibacillus shirakamiensis TaxID=1265935 RepID=A0ABS4JHQ2_9BACL|nr:substrate-binding domain-containing protein [Paenibacillus shirakamiensis]MBP2001245.1 LacI family transcriptional regulator [Paenibacillus shirakamiensis]
MNPTIKDVARQAQVSIATVSRVLNNLTGYSEETKVKVLQVIKEMGYQPNAIARGLINKRTQTLAVIFPCVSNSFSAEVLHGIEEVAHRHQHSVIVCNTSDDGKRTLNYLQVLREKQVDGIIFASEVLQDSYYEALQAMKVPVVLIATETDKPHIPYVKVNDKQASYDAVNYLITHGHRHIAMMGGTKDDLVAGVPRVEGYKQALADHHLPYREEWIVHADFQFDSGCTAMEQLLTRPRDYTAIFAASDEMAVAIMTVAAKHGIRIPGDLSVIGYDNVKLAEMVVPPLTTVHQPLVEMGEMACEKLLTMIQTGETVDNTIALHSIVERKTVSDLRD